VRYKGGVLEWRKVTWPVIDGHPCNLSHVVFYDGRWTGYVSDKIIGIDVWNLYDGKGQGPAWIDDYIQKLTSALSPR